MSKLGASTLQHAKVTIILAISPTDWVVLCGTEDAAWLGTCDAAQEESCALATCLWYVIAAAPLVAAAPNSGVPSREGSMLAAAHASQTVMMSVRHILFHTCTPALQVRGVRMKPFHVL